MFLECVIVSSLCFQILESDATWLTVGSIKTKEGERIEKRDQAKTIWWNSKNNSICTTALKGKKKSNNQLMSCREALNLPYEKTENHWLSLSYIALTSNIGVGPLYLSQVPPVCQVDKKFSRAWTYLCWTFCQSLTCSNVPTRTYLQGPIFNI